MDPITIAAIAQIISTGLKLYANHTNKPEGWFPTEADWKEIELLSNKTAMDYKREAS